MYFKKYLVMNKILYIFILSLVISCDSNDLEDTPTDEQPTSQVMDLEATGTLANETIEKAKEIIYGRWNLSNGSETGSSNMSIAKNTIVSPTSCAFEYIEFTDENYILGFVVDGEPFVAFGDYKLNEDSNGFVTSVDLYFEIEGFTITIASLTNVVVIEENNEIFATFTIELQVPDEFEICNDLEGIYSGEKEEAMDESYTSDINSNHYLLVHTWTLTSVIEDGKDITSDFYADVCYDYNPETDDEEFVEGCTPTTNISLTFSSYGTYTFMETGSSEGMFIETDTWSWYDNSQTSFYVGNLDENFIITIESINESDVVFFAEEDGMTVLYNFNR